MSSFKTLYFIIASCVIAGCSGITAPESSTPRPLLEVEQYNYAWIKYYAGFYVNEAGDVVKYDRKGAMWSKQDDETGSVNELLEKYDNAAVQGARADDVNAVSAKVGVVDPKAVIPGAGRCADAGTTTFWGYKWDGERYTRVLLYRAGDVQQKNTTQAAQDLVAYLKSLNLVTIPTGCEP